METMAQENDVVLIYFEDQPMTFARIESIQADHKPDWYHVKLLLLQVPLQPVTWILRTAYIDGAEFTMNGNRMRMAPVVCPDDALPEIPEPEEDAPPDPGGKDGRVISFPGLKKP
ncbi:hypothetical protein [Desulfococcus multivorans]|nr:hypothetical protein [Desulfococcus multivorans]AOY60197.1 conserved uncharacterized protein [Desulfococcus multivorans]